MTTPLANGEPLTPGRCHRCGVDGPVVARPCGDSACKSTECIDLCAECVGQHNYDLPPTGLPLPTWSDFTEYRRAVMQHMADLTSHVTDFDSGLPRTATGVSAMMAGPVEEAGGAQLTPEVMEAARVHLRSTPFREDSVASRIMDDLHRRDLGWQHYPWSDGDTQFVLDDPHDDDRVYFAPGLPMRPDHYRVHPGRCICGFQTAFVGDMEDHLTERVIATPDGNKTWRVCECGESTLCRRVAVPHVGPFHYANPADLSSPPLTDSIYLCDSCCQRRGIGTLRP